MSCSTAPLICIPHFLYNADLLHKQAGTLSGKTGSGPRHAEILTRAASCDNVYRGKFGIPATNLTTKGESIEFSTPSIEGTVTRRNKVDGQGKHPWKAEVSEDDTGVLPATISGWYEEVYEPDYSTLETA